MTDNIVFLNTYFKPKPQANVVEHLLTSMVANYNDVLSDFKIDIEDPMIAFDIATIQYLLRGMAHRSQGQDHPSQKILNAMRSNLMGT